MLKAALGAALKALLAPLRAVLRLLLALVILFEEWGWAPLARAMAWLGRLPVLRRIEQWVRSLPPYAALALFALPTLLLLPVKLLALWLMGAGRAGLGLLVIVLAKLIGTAVVARLFVLTQPALMQLSWFARGHVSWMAWKAELLAWVHASAAWREYRRLKGLARRLWRHFKRRA